MLEGRRCNRHSYRDVFGGLRTASFHALSWLPRQSPQSSRIVNHGMVRQQVIQLLLFIPNGGVPGLSPSEPRVSA